jgi:hypothetical protein
MQIRIVVRAARERSRGGSSAGAGPCSHAGSARQRGARVTVGTLEDCAACAHAGRPDGGRNTSRAAAGTHVHIGVAAGERIGVSSGRIRNPREREVDVAPVGSVPHLVAVDAEVAQGSSGAPVVDADLTVRGYIVAGGKKQAFMYPSYRWAAELRAIQAATPKRNVVRKRARRKPR